MVQCLNLNTKLLEMAHPDSIEHDSLLLQERVDKIANNQSSLINKFDILTKSVEELKRILTQLTQKVSSLEDAAVDKNKIKNEIVCLRSRIEELFVIVKDGKEDASDRSDVQDIESCHSGFSNSSKVK